MSNFNMIFLPLKNMEVHEKIRAIRQAKGYTQDYIADKLSIDTVNYGRIERGQSNLTVERFLLICKILDINPSVIFDDNFKDRQDTIMLFTKIYEEVKEINNKLK